MSQDLDVERVTRGERWSFSAAKLAGWLTGLGFAVFGGLLCSVPVGAVLGLPVVAIGVFVCLSFSISMSAAVVSRRIAMPLVLIGLIVLLLGREFAPIDRIAESFRTGQTHVKRTGLAGAFGIPLMLIGMHVVQIATPWVRWPDRLGFTRGVVALLLILAASLVLLSGAAMTLESPDWRAQPLWAWPVVPVLFTLGVGARERWRGLSWLLILLWTAAILPATWLVLVSWPR